MAQAVFDLCVFDEVAFDEEIVPTAIPQAASNLEATAARINGKISDDGGESCEARFRWSPIEELIEQQLDYDGYGHIDGVYVHRIGQRLTITNRFVTKLGFTLQKVGNPTGDAYFRIRKVSDDSIIASKTLDASSINTSFTYYEVEFDSATYVNEEVRIFAEFYGGDGDNRLRVRFYNEESVKSDEYVSEYSTAYGFEEYETWDATYKYTYYVLEWTTTEWQNTLVTDSEYHEDLVDLEPGTEYEFQTQAKNSAGESEWTESAYFTTLIGQPTMRRWGGSILPIGAQRIGKGW